MNFVPPMTKISTVKSYALATVHGRGSLLRRRLGSTVPAIQHAGAVGFDQPLWPRSGRALRCAVAPSLPLESHAVRRVQASIPPVSAALGEAADGGWIRRTTESATQLEHIDAGTR